MVFRLPAHVAVFVGLACHIKGCLLGQLNRMQARMQAEHLPSSRTVYQQSAGMVDCLLPASMDVGTALGPSRCCIIPCMHRVDVLLLCWFVFWPGGPCVMCASPVKLFAAHLGREVDTAIVRRECRCLQACDCCLFPCWHAFVCAPLLLYAPTLRGHCRRPCVLIIVELWFIARPPSVPAVRRRAC